MIILANKKSKAIATSIRYTSRMSLKIGETFYTMEACEERTLPNDLTPEEVQTEREFLWDCVNEEVDKQAADIWKANQKAPR